MTSKAQTQYKPGDTLKNRHGMELFLIHEILAGSMGEVYLCLDLEKNLPFALKTFKQGNIPQADKEKIKKDFENEANVWINLHKHPNIVRCHSVILLGEQPYLKLEWITGDDQYGVSLGNWVKHGALKLRKALDFAIHICRGLVHAQRMQPGIVHRDLKPDNILVDHKHVAKISDFGLAKVARMIDKEERLFGGTPPYMAPEQWQGTGLDPRTDIYAVGCVLYEMLMGRPAFVASGWRQYRQLHLEAPIPSLQGMEGHPNLDKLDYLIRRCLAKQHEDRFESAGILLAELVQVYQSIFAELPEEQSSGTQLDVDDYIDRSMALLRLNRSEEALRELDKAMQLDPNRAEIYINRGVYYHNVSKQYSAALANYSRAIEVAPLNPLAYHNRGDVYKQQHEYEKAISDLSEAIRLGLESGKFRLMAQTYNKRGTIYEELERFDEALEDYRAAIKIDPAFAMPYYNIGDVLKKTKSYREALMYYEKAAQLGHPSAARQVIALRKMDIFLDRASGTEKFVDAVNHLNTDILFLSTTIHRVQSLEDMRQAVRGYSNLIQPSFIEFFEKSAPALEFFEGDPLAKQKLEWLKQIALEHQIQTEDAHRVRLIALNEAIQQSPELAQHYLERGKIYVELADYDKALSDINTAIQLDPLSAEVYVARGRVFMATEQYEQALSAYGEAIRQKPDFAYAYALRADVYKQMRMLDQSIADYSEAISLYPEWPEAYGNRGIAYNEMGEQEKAFSDYNEAIRLNSTQPEVYSNRSNVYLNRGQYDEALADMTRAIKLAPDKALLYANRGVVLERLGRLDEASGDLQKAVRLDPRDYQNHFALANLYAQSGKYDESLKHYNEALQLAPDKVVVYLNRSNVYATLGRYQDALGDLDKAVGLEPTYARAYSNRGATYATLGRTEDAIADYLHAIELAPDYAHAYKNLGSLLTSQGRLTEALSYFQAAARLGDSEGQRGLMYVQRWLEVAADPRQMNLSHLLEISARINTAADARKILAELPFLKSPSTMAALEQSLSQMPFHLQDRLRTQIGWMKESLQALAYQSATGFNDIIARLDRVTRKLEHDPEDLELLLYRADLYRRLGSLEAALADVDRILALSSMHAGALLLRGSIYMELGHLDEAISDSSKAIEIEPDQAMAYYNRATSYLFKNQLDKALPDFDRSIAIDPAYQPAFVNRGSVKMQLGNMSEALEDFTRAISLDPRDPDAYSNRGVLYKQLSRYAEARADLFKAVRLAPDDAGIHLNLGLVLADTDELEQALSHFEEAVNLGSAEAEQYAVQIRRALGMAPTNQPSRNEIQAAFEAFQRTNSLEEMRRAFQQNMILAQLIPAIEQAIEKQVPHEFRSDYRRRLAWLRRVIQEASPSLRDQE